MQRRWTSRNWLTKEYQNKLEKSPSTHYDKSQTTSIQKIMKWVKNAIIAAAILAVGLFVSKTLGGMSTKEEIKEDNIKLQVRVMDAKLDTVALPLTVYGRLNAANRADL